ncbi:hypothetical protein KVP06_08575 [Geobacter sulfurreducens]|uniref:YbgF trimerisation domain-containing protein n=1 Tax=Geobacter sulfurreducens (strain ATCC 51573 / DSM 12127 / PCA) TaxID=243231 RepID=Q74CG2_GEOSL|nr:hypothetical protein [Geobacter sulfurreducens]AAR35089.1 hypothetical protein GSU1712 [Geobacter sulfurreducens PCA]UAC05707.1 hypothetical protein KVP06_08575 [Geobacter sulfurreducens]
MSALRLALLFLLLATPALAKDLNGEVEELKLQVSTLEYTINSQRSTINRLKELQEEHEALLKKLVIQYWELKEQVEKQKKATR